MAEKLFENVGGNQFKLLTESMNQNKAKLIREGLKKVFANAKEDLTYDKIGNFGLGFIKDVTEARKCALQEARDIAPGLGFADHPETGTFVKEVSWHDEESYKQSHGDPYDTEPWPDEPDKEKREVQIGKEILRLTNDIDINRPRSVSVAISNIDELAQELIKMHGSK